MISGKLISLAALALAVTMSSALARPRDDVMAGAYRCAGIANSRQWLDCFYGVAQPVRAELGLPPAPQQQVALATTPPVGGAPQDPELRDSVLAEASRCYTVSGEHEWLNCYYAAAQPLRASLGLSAGPQRPFQPPPPSNFGLAPKPVLHTPIGIRAQMAEYKFDQFGKFTVRLADGQVWRQMAGDSSLAHWEKPAASYTVEIRKGAFGSFNLSAEHVGGVYKVQRLE
jgi:hypothetical protein